MRIRTIILALAVTAALATAASANTVPFSLSCGGVSCGSVTFTDTGANTVHVVVTMTGGYTIQAKANSGGFLFNTVSGLTLSLSNFNTVEFGSVSAVLTSGVNNGQGSFTGGVVKFGLPSGNTSVSGISFNLTGMTTANLLANSNGNTVSVHYCSPGANGGISTNCPSPTGFASSTPGSPVPEPGTLSMMGTGLIGLAGLVRRRFFS